MNIAPCLNNAINSQRCMKSKYGFLTATAIDYTSFDYVKVSRDLDYLNFFLKKIIVGHYEGEILPPLAQMVLTLCTSISELLVHPVAPPGGQI